MKKLLETLKLKWAEYLLEMIVITMGILGAFGLNNWNQNRLNEIEEKRLLVFIHDSMNQYHFLIEGASNRQEKKIEAIVQLLEVIQDASVELSSEQIDEHLFTVLHARWLLGAGTNFNVYDVLTDGDKLGLISSQDLQEELSSLKANFAYALAYDELQTNFVDNQLSPFMNQYMDRLSVAKATIGLDSQVPTDRFKTSYEELMKSREFSNLLVELLRHTKPMIPNNLRLMHNINKIDSLTLQE